MTTPVPTITTDADPYTAATYAAEWQTAMETVQAHYVAEAAALFVAWQAGKLATPEWRRAFTLSLVDGVAAGTGIGDGLASRVLHLAHDRPVLPMGVGVSDVLAEIERLHTAVSTLAKAIDTAEDPRPRIERIAKSEPVAAAQRAAVAVFDAHQVIGYTRGTDADPCELCVWLKKEHLRPGGYIYPTDQPMHRHPGCCCVPIPVTEGEA